MQNYDGSHKWQAIEARLHREGFALSFSCTYTDRAPAGFYYTGKESGWEMRRKLKAYCAASGITDYRIIRNTSYLRDLHGPAVYELWVRPAAEPA